MSYHQHTDTVELLVARLHEDAAARDSVGGTPHKERQMLRESGLLNLIIPQRFRQALADEQRRLTDILVADPSPEGAF